eukprot:1724880-Rhodomonas_salina.1
MPVTEIASGADRVLCVLVEEVSPLLRLRSRRWKKSARGQQREHERSGEFEGPRQIQDCCLRARNALPGTDTAQACPSPAQCAFSKAKSFSHIMCLISTQRCPVLKSRVRAACRCPLARSSYCSPHKTFRLPGWMCDANVRPRSDDMSRGAHLSCCIQVEVAPGGGITCVSAMHFKGKWAARQRGCYPALFMNSSTVCGKHP